MPLPFNNMHPSVAVTQTIVSSGVYPSFDSGSHTMDVLGAIRHFAFNFAPTGTYATHGQLLSVSSHTALFSLLGSEFGGDGDPHSVCPTSI